MNGSGSTVSAWMKTARVATVARLESDIEADVCVIGAGISGLTTAYLLAREGMAVAVLDDGGIADGETARTTAHLSNEIDDRYTEIARVFGKDGARLAADAHTAAIDAIESISAEERIECDFLRLDGYLFLGHDSSASIIDEELVAAARAGLAPQMVERAPLEGIDTGPAIRFPRQGQFHPLKYMAGLAAAVIRRGGRIYSGAHADQYEGGRDAFVWTSDGRKVTADTIVVATNAPIGNRVSIHTKQAPYRTYVLGARVPRGSVERALYWDTADPYHYVRLQPMEPREGGEPFDLLIVGGEDHKTGQANDGRERLERLEAWARERFPSMRETRMRWSGQVVETMDGLAYIGKNPGDEPNVFIATGDSGMGMTHGTIAGLLLTDLIFGRDNAWAEIFKPSRKKAAAWKDYVKENLSVALQYTDYATGADVDSVHDIRPGEGAVMRHGAGLAAVRRDEAGGEQMLSAKCRHLGCIVHWNSLEKSWDCPCHGSRYDTEGANLDAPAHHPLERVEVEEPAAAGGAGAAQPRKR